MEVLINECDAHCEECECLWLYNTGLSEKFIQRLPVMLTVRSSCGSDSGELD